jgi:hypothetical protein
MKRSNEDIVRFSSLGLILISFIIELNMLSFSDRSRILSLLYGLFIIFYLYVFINFKLRFPRLMIVLISFLAYLAFLSFFSSNRVVSYNYLAKFTFGLLSFVTGYNFFYRSSNLKMIARSTLVILTLGLTITYLNNFRHTGISLYENDFYGQSLATTYNTFALLVIIILTLSFYYTKREIVYSVFLSFLTILLLFLVFKRSPILIIGLAGLSTLLFSSGLFRVNSKVRRNLLLLVLLLLITYPIYRKPLENNLLVRQAAFESTIEEQPRYKENIAVFEQIKNNPVTFLFGTGDVFNSKGMVIYRDRMLHTDYANILWSGGMIGFFVYFGFYIALLRKFIKARVFSGRQQLSNNIAFAGIIMIQSYLICAISQAWTSISVMSIVMLTCGAAYGFLRTQGNGYLPNRKPGPESLSQSAGTGKKEN